MIKFQWLAGAFFIAFGNLTILNAGRHWSDAVLALAYLAFGLIMQIGGSYLVTEK